VSRAVLEAQPSVLTNKYAEGLPGRRYYGGGQFVEIAENLVIERATKLFGRDRGRGDVSATLPGTQRDRRKGGAAIAT